MDFSNFITIYTLIFFISSFVNISYQPLILKYIPIFSLYFLTIHIIIFQSLVYLWFIADVSSNLDEKILSIYFRAWIFNKILLCIIIMTSIDTDRFRYSVKESLYRDKNNLYYKNGNANGKIILTYIDGAQIRVYKKIKN